MVGLPFKKAGEQDGTEAEAKHPWEGVHACMATDMSAGVRTLNELRATHGVPSMAIGQWTRPLLDEAPEVFRRGSAGGVRHEKKPISLWYEEIGWPKMEGAWRKKLCAPSQMPNENGSKPNTVRCRSCSSVRCGTGSHSASSNRADGGLHCGRGLEVCNRTSFKGRIPLHELLRGSAEMKRFIQSRVGTADMLSLAMKEGISPLVQAGIYKVLRGETT